jgi:hypothetical protein
LLSCSYSSWLHSLRSHKLETLSSLSYILAPGFFLVIPSPAIFCLSAVYQHVFLSHSLLCSRSGLSRRQILNLPSRCLRKVYLALDWQWTSIINAMEICLSRVAEQLTVLGGCHVNVSKIRYLGTEICLCIGFICHIIISIIISFFFYFRPLLVSSKLSIWRSLTCCLATASSARFVFLRSCPAIECNSSYTALLSSIISLPN